MRQMGLSALYPKPRTSQPGAGHKVYPYLADRRDAAHREGDLKRAAALSRELNVHSLYEFMHKLGLDRLK